MLLRTQDRNQRLVIVSLVVGIAVLAWLSLLNPPGFVMSGMDVHAQLHASVDKPDPSVQLQSIGIFLMAWLVMTAAMMLPTALPMVATFARLSQPPSHASGRVMLFVSGYFVAWIGFGLAAYLFDLPVHLAVHRSAFLTTHSQAIEAGLLCLAGVFQFTPLKRRCLSQCRSPLSFLMNHWHAGSRGALRMGVSHGAFCVGCCWAIMLLMFGLGMGHLGWMLALTLLMFVEKVVQGGERVGHAVGLLFLAAGLITLGVTFAPALP